MLTRQRSLFTRLTHLPWWAYILPIVGFYLLGWALHLIGVIPGQ